MTETTTTPATARHNRLTDLAGVQVGQQLAYLAGRLPAPPARLLDAGCGGGELARALSARGYDVTAVDNDPHMVAAARARGVPVAEADIAEYDDRPFDAVLFSLSLHHVDRLDEAVAGARALLKPGGVLVADEFAWECADRTTSAWFYDAAALLEAAGVLNRERVTAIDDPLRQWVRRHRDEDPMHTGRAMIDAIADRLELLDRDRVPYLYRYLGGWLTDDTVGVRAFTALHDVERHRVADGNLAPVGLRLLAQR